MKYLKINIVLLLLLSYIIPCYAYDFYVGGVYYYITSNENKTVRVTYSDKPYHTYDYSGEINIPSEVSYNGITYTVTAIGYQAFKECINLTSVNLPKTITSIGNEAFKNTNSISTIYCQSENPPDICSDTFDNYNITIVVPNASLEAYKNAYYWKYFIHIIPFYDFEYNGVYYKVKNETERIVEVTYKDTGYSSYSDTISIPNQVLYNGNNYEVKYIGQSAFRNSTHLQSVVIPNSITMIDSYAFYNCSELMNITCYAATPPSLQSTSFNSYNATVRVPKVYLNSYKSSYFWKNFSNLVSIFSYDFEQNGVFYNINSLTDNTVDVTYKDANYNSYSGVINIPSTVTHNNIVYNIISIGDSAFYKSANLTNVHIPSSVLTLGHSCFEDCSSITSIDIPSSISTIASNALKGCYSLDTLVFNAISCANFNSSTTNHPFNNLNISTIIIGDEVQRIPEYFAYNLNSLKNVSIGNSVTYIGSNSFNNCSGIESITIPKNVSYIGYNAFKGCSALTTVNFNAVSCNNFNSSSSYHPFNNLNILTINFSDDVQKIPNYFADGLSKLKNVNFGQSMTSIGDFSFYNCTSLDNVLIPNSVLTIGESSFGNCTSLNKITIPYSVLKIGKAAFLNCSSLIELEFNANNCEDFISESPFKNTSIATINIGNHVERIPAYLATELITLRKVNIGNSVKLIGMYAFKGCKSLTNINFGNSVETIDNLSFLHCTNLECLLFPNSLKRIGTSAFFGCSGLTMIILPTSLTTIGESAFNYCDGIQSVYSYAENPPIMGSDDSFTVYNTATLYVPNLYLDTYKNTLYWSRFLKIYGLDENNNVLASGIALNFTQKSLNVNQTLQLIATVTPDVASNKTVTWSSSDSNIATVNNEGFVTGIADGNATITATTTDGTNLSASCYLTVTSIPVTSIKLNKTRLTLDIDDSYQLVATIAPSNATDKTIVWSSSNTAIATVSDNGLVIPNEPGDAVITASTTDGTNLSASCQVTVIKRVKGITLNESSLSLTLPETAQLTALVSPNDATNAVLNWTSSKPSVATVDNNGFIISKSAGTTTIKATTTDGSNLSATCQVTVSKQYVNSILLNKDSLIMHIGETFQLIADVQPENASYPTLNWKSNNSSVASVDNTGLITANSGGTTLICVSATDGSNISSSCFVKVMPDYYIEIDSLSHIRGSSSQIVDLPVSLINKNPVSGIQFDVSLPDDVQFNTIKDMPDIWLDDARGTRSHSISASKLNDGKYRILVTSSTSKNLKGNDGELVHMNLVLPQVHDSGDCSIILSNIIASEADETRHNLDNKSTYVHFYYIVGDADANAIVDIADHASTASKILGMSPTPFYFEAANVDANGSLDVVDLVGITNIALGIKPITVRQAPVRDGVENHLFCEKLNLNAGEDREITIGIDCGFDFAGFQMDLKLPNGLNLTGVVLGEDAAGLGIASETMSDGTIRILGTSFSDAEIDGICRVLITLKVKANNNYMHGSEIEFLNILFAERNLTAHAFDASNIEYIEPSSIYELMEDARIYIEDGNIIVDTPFEEFVRLIAVDGRMVEYRAHIGHNVYKINANGIYIIHFNGKTIKVRL